jgi:hypothetical protein
MRLEDRLKNGIQNAQPGRQWLFGFAIKALIFITISWSDNGLAFVSTPGCAPEAMSALPDQPVALTRVERSEDGQVRVMWPLRLGAEEAEIVALPRQLQSGAEFDVLRCLPPGRWVALGQGEVVSRNGELVEGLLSLSGRGVSVERGVKDELVSSGNLHPTPMVGDLVVLRRKEISQKTGISPRVTIAVESLFGGSTNGTAIELTQLGEESLRHLISGKFAEARGRLLIEVHARRSGSRTKLREETTQRAKSIERYLRYEFSLNSEQVISVGMGSDTYVPGFVAADEASDVVVLRMLPSNTSVY